MLISRASLAFALCSVLDAASALGALQYEEASLTPADSAFNFGAALSIEGDTVVVGASQDENGGLKAGAAYVFRRGIATVDEWTQVKKIRPFDNEALDEFGSAVAISGDTVLIGAARDADEGSGPGSAYIFQQDRGGPDNWGLLKKLVTSVPHGFIGEVVSLDGDTAILADQSQAYVFERHAGGTDNWGEVKVIPRPGSPFFSGVAIDGDTAVVGARLFGDGVGVYVFGRDVGGPDDWGLVKLISASVGVAVSLSGDHLVTADGPTKVFERNAGGPDSWGLVDTLAAGQSATIDGDMLVVGDYSNAALRVYERSSGGGSWPLRTELRTLDPRGHQSLGWATAISGSTVLGGLLQASIAFVFDQRSARMFVTAGTYPADFGGLPAADALCRAEADAAGVAGVWKSFLSVPGTDRQDRVPAGLRIQRIDRAPLADDAGQLGGPISNPLDRDPTGATVPLGSHVWTGDSDADGNCLGFTSTAGDVGQYGITSETNLNWQAAGNDACTASNRLYCFQFNCPLTTDPACNDGFAKGTLLVKEAKAGKEKLRADLKAGPALGQSDLGTPLDPDGSAYTACFYDDADELVAQVQIDRAGELCSGKPCWRPIGALPPDGKGYRYKDSTLSEDGAQRIQLRGGAAGKSKLSIRAANSASKEHVDLPRLAAALSGSATATIQLHGSDLAQCFSVTVQTSKSTETFFYGKK